MNSDWLTGICSFDLLLSIFSYNLLYSISFNQAISFNLCIFAANFESGNMSHKAGYVNIIGNPNVGKSTLMNQLVGEKLSIITSKSQTTRHRILGIVNGEDFQIVYSDTPGILKPNYKLQESMMRFVDTALIDADVIVYVTDIYETIDKNMNYIDKVNKAKAPVILVVNKIDQSNQDELEEKVELQH